MADFDPGELDVFRKWLNETNRADKSSLGRMLDRTLRTVERWGVDEKSNKQYRRYIPKSTWNKPIKDWTPQNKRRLALMRMVKDCVKNNDAGKGAEREFKEEFGDLGSAIGYMEDVLRGNAPQWLMNLWRELCLEKRNNKWRVVVRVDKDGSGYARNPDADDRMRALPEWLSMLPGFDDPYGDPIFG